MSATDPAAQNEFNLAMRERIVSLGAVPAITDLDKPAACNILHRQLINLLGAGGGSSSEFIFRPGGVASGNVYTDWALLYADAVLAPGPITIYIDDTFVSPAPAAIPAGNWDFPRWDVTLSGANAFAFAQVSVADGSTFNGLAKIDNFLSLTANNTVGPLITAPPVTPAGAPAVLIVERGGNLFNAGTVEMIRVPADVFYAIGLVNQAAIATSNVVNVIDGVLGFSGVFIACQAAATVDPDTIRSTGANTLLTFNFFDASKLVDFTGQPGFLGIVGTDLFESGGNIQYLEGSLADWSGTPPGTIANALDRLAAALGPIA